MKRTAALIAGLLIVGGIAWTEVAHAALSQVRVGNFYYEDATVGDGEIQIRQGDQLRFIVEDDGPGTPHSVEVDALGIHSGGLSTGDTYTTPPIQQTGSFRLYCKLHENREHVTTLVVRAGTTSPTTTTVAAATPAPAPPTTAGGSSTSTSAQPPPPPSDSPGATGTDDTGAPAAADTTGGATINPADTTADATIDPADTTDTTLASGLGRASAKDLHARPVGADSLEASLGRPPATRGPWTRSVRMALLALVPLLGAAAMALTRFARAPDLAGSVDPTSSRPPSLDARDGARGVLRERPLRADSDARDRPPQQ
ncbi:MAG: hypothetical protein Q8K58_03140 [Acidimicrobiales bacterium]|nr:hypothetical protein [Acidimicrobiales bacterium]